MFFNGFKLTSDQNEAMDVASSLPCGETLKLAAGAGCAKTFTLTAMAHNAFSSNRVLYLAFNRNIVAEIKAKMPANVTCATWHSLAMNEIGSCFDKVQLEMPFTGRVIAEKLNIRGSYCGLTAVQFSSCVVQIIKNYCDTVDMSITEKHIEISSCYLKRLSISQQDELKSKALLAANGLWLKLFRDNSLPISFDVIFKYFSLLILTDQITLPYDVFLLDEAQDTSILCKAVFEHLHGKKVLVGDSHQALYAWRKAIDAMTTITSNKEVQLYQSFRYGQCLSDLSMRLLAKYKGGSPEYIGNPKIETRLITNNFDVVQGAVLSRTNCNVVSNILQRVERGGDCSLIGGAGDLLALIRSIDMLQNNIIPTNKEIAQFQDWSDLKDYSHTEDGYGYRTIISHVEKHGISRLINGLSKLNNDNNIHSLKFGNVHQSKGLEFDHVMLDNDFKRLQGNNIIEETNIAYVAITRAKYTLDVSRCDLIRELV